MKISVDKLYEAGLKPLKIEEIKGIGDDNLRIFIKKEHNVNSYDFLRTVKRKPAVLILEDLSEKGWIQEGKTLITSSSGNFAIELGLRAYKLGYKLIAVVPPRIPTGNLEVLRALGVDVIYIEMEFDLCPRETTVFYTRALAEKYRYGLVNIDQYNSWQNVLSHLFLTWGEIREQFDSLDYIIAPLGSTGTYMGLSLGKSIDGINTKIVGVQPPLTHNIPGVHHIIDGCVWNPEIFCMTISDEIITVDDIDTYATLIKLWEAGYEVGPSTAMTLAAALKLSKVVKGDYLIISPDSTLLYYEFIRDYLEKNRVQLLKRYPELEDLLDKYILYLTKKLNQLSLIDRIKRSYKIDRWGRLYPVSKIDDQLIARELIST